MGVNNLSSEARGFLYTFFNEASKPFRFGTFDAAEAGPASKIAWDFGVANGTARRGSQPEMDQRIEDLKQSVAQVTTPALLDAVDTLRTVQKLMYKNASPQLRADLGTYSNGIF